MKIALISISSHSIPDQLYSHYIEETCGSLMESGHEVTVFNLAGDSDVNQNWSEGILLKQVNFPGQSAASYYLDRQQAISDEILREVLAEQNASQYDVIEFPLWGGVGLGLVRAKRLLNEFKGTKLIVNAVSAAFMFADDADDSLSIVLQNEMEQYCVRYADVVTSPFEPLGEMIKSKFGRSDVRYYDGTALSAVLEPMEPDVQGCKSVIQTMLKQHQPSYIPISTVEIYSSEGRTRFLRSARQVKVSAVIPFLGNESLTKFLDTLNSFPHLTIEKLVYCSSEDEALCSEFQILDLEDLVKIQTANSAVALDEVLNSCSGDYLIFLKEGLSFNAEYLPRAVSALEQNSDISAIGSYCCGQTGLKIPFGTVPGLMGISNTCAMWGNVFRTSKLRQLNTESNPLVWRANDWPLLLSLVTKYQLLDVMPFSGLQYDMDPTEVKSSTSSQDILLQMAAFPRVWSSFSSRLLRLLIQDRELLNPVVGGQDGTCPVFELPLQSLELPEVQMHKVLGDINDQSVQIAIADKASLGETSISAAASPERDLKATDSVESETDFDGLELPSNARDQNQEDSTTIISEKVDKAGETEEEETGLSIGEAVDSKSSEVENTSADAVDGLKDQTDPGMDPLEGDADGPMTFQEEPSEVEDEPGGSDDSKIDSEGAADAVGFVDEEDGNDEGEDWREFPESSEITLLGEESEENTLHSIEEEVIVSNPLSLAKPGPDGEFESSQLEEDDNDPLDWFQVFWSPEEEFKEENSVTESYHAAETHALEIRIETDKPVKKLRLDPSNRKGTLALRRIEIWNAATHMPVYSSSEENAFDNLVPSGDFEVEGIVHDSLVLDALGRDPQILVDIPEPDADRIIISVEFNFIRENPVES